MGAGCGGIPALVSQALGDPLFPAGPGCGGASLVPLPLKCVSAGKGHLRPGRKGRPVATDFRWGSSDVCRWFTWRVSEKPCFIWRVEAPARQLSLRRSGRTLYVVAFLPRWGLSRVLGCFSSLKSTCLPFTLSQCLPGIAWFTIPGFVVVLSWG